MRTGRSASEGLSSGKYPCFQRESLVSVSGNLSTWRLPRGSIGGNEIVEPREGRIFTALTEIRLKARFLWVTRIGVPQPSAPITANSLLNLTLDLGHP